MNTRFDAASDASTAKAKPGKPRQSKNWIHVNIGEREAKEIRALAECEGMPYRSFLEFAVRSYVRNHAEVIKREFGVNEWEISKISKARRREIGAARRRMIEACRDFGLAFPERN